MIKSDKLYPTYKEIEQREKLIKKYGIRESQLTGRTSSQLSPINVNTVEKKK